MALPDYTTQDAATYKANIDSSVADAVTPTSTDTLSNKTINGGTIHHLTSVACTTQSDIEFTGIPSWAKRITIHFEAVSRSSNSQTVMYLSDASAGYASSGYHGGYQTITSGGQSVTGDNTTTIGLFGGVADTAKHFTGQLVLTLMDPVTHKWTGQGAFYNNDATDVFYTCACSADLTDDLDAIQISGTGTFDAGFINVCYE